MKTFFTGVAWTFGFVFLIFAFVLIFQKQQNDHEEKMIAEYSRLDSQKHLQTLDLINLNSKKNVFEKAGDFFRSVVSMVISCFGG